MFLRFANSESEFERLSETSASKEPIFPEYRTGLNLRKISKRLKMNTNVKYIKPDKNIPAYPRELIVRNNEPGLKKTPVRIKPSPEKRAEANKIIKELMYR